MYIQSYATFLHKKMTDSPTIVVVNDPGYSVRFKGSAIGSNGYQMTFHTNSRGLRIRWWKNHGLIAERTDVELPSSCYHRTLHPEKENYSAQHQIHYNVDECMRFCQTFLQVEPTQDDRDTTLAYL
jgi:hypothetical protein